MESNQTEECYECGGTNGIEKHHVIPQSMGGEKTVPLCFICHSKVHGLNRKEPLSLLIKRGMRKARMKGKKIGRKKGTSEDIHKFLSKYQDVAYAIKQGQSIRNVAKHCDVSPSTVQKVKRAIQLIE